MGGESIGLVHMVGFGEALDGGFVEGRAAAPRDRRGDDRSTYIRLSSRRFSQVRPRHVGLDKRLLQEVLRQLVVADNRERQTEQGRRPGLNEFSKRGDLLRASRRHGPLLRPSHISSTK